MYYILESAKSSNHAQRNWSDEPVLSEDVNLLIEVARSMPTKQNICTYELIASNIQSTSYTDEGLEFLVNRKSTARAMSLESGLTGIVTPLHIGAIKYWRSKGKVLTDAQKRYP